MIIHIILVPPDIISHYKLNELVDKDGCIYMKIIQGMYGLSQAVILANNLLAHRFTTMDINKSNKNKYYDDMCGDLFL